MSSPSLQSIQHSSESPKNNGILHYLQPLPPSLSLRTGKQDDAEEKSQLIVILGPTASGKTGWAFKFCEKFNGEIVSADSRQIYNGMDIGAGKDFTPKIIQHMIDIVNPNEILTLPEYKQRAIEKIYDIIERGKIPFLVGGTGLYISAIVDNLEIPEVKPDWELREKLEKKNLKDLQDKLKKVDPKTYKATDLKNKRRLIRALEVSKITGKPFSSLRKKGDPLFDCLQIGIDAPKEELGKKIDLRIEQMKKDGLEEEVKKLSKKYSWSLPSMSGIGYKEFKNYFDCYVTLPLNSPSSLKFPLLSEEELRKVCEEIKKHTKQYAKRQMTWFKRDKRIVWVKDYKEVENKIEKFLQK